MVELIEEVTEVMVGGVVETMLETMSGLLLQFISSEFLLKEMQLEHVFTFVSGPLCESR